MFYYTPRPPGEANDGTIQLVDLFVRKSLIDVTPCRKLTGDRSCSVLRGLLQIAGDLNDHLLAFCKRVADDAFQGGTIILAQISYISLNGYHATILPRLAS